jgi:glycosyltransferase involved in cell wall biosynthesis
MKICFLADSVDEQSAGVHVYTLQLLRALLLLDTQNEYILVHSCENPIFDAWVKAGEGRISQKIVPGWRKFPFWPSFRKFLLLPLFLRFWKPDIVFEPAHMGPFSWFWKCKKVVMIHDLTPVLFPQFHIWISRFIHARLLPLIFSQVDGIVVPSVCTQKDVERLYAPRCPIAVVYEAADENYKPVSSELVLRVKEHFGISKPYILSVGTLEPRKNLQVLLEAFCLLNGDYSLVIVGKKGWYYSDLLQHIQGAQQKEADIIVTGYVDESDLDALYSGAEVMVYPSLYEGFGLPPLEAMQCGCPVICSNTSSLPEVVGEAGVVFDPCSVDSLVGHLRKVLSDATIRMRLQQQGIERAQLFSWQKCAQETLDFFTRVYEA